jgi:hypothetical protein
MRRSHVLTDAGSWRSLTAHPTMPVLMEAGVIAAIFATAELKNCSKCSISKEIHVISFSRRIRAALGRSLALLVNLGRILPSPVDQKLCDYTDTAIRVIAT